MGCKQGTENETPREVLDCMELLVEAYASGTLRPASHDLADYADRFRAAFDREDAELAKNVKSMATRNRKEADQLAKMPLKSDAAKFFRDVFVEELREKADALDGSDAPQSAKANDGKTVQRRPAELADVFGEILRELRIANQLHAIELSGSREHNSIRAAMEGKKIW